MSNESEFNINKNDPFYITVKTVFDNWTALQVIDYCNSKFSGHKIY